MKHSINQFRKKTTTSNVENQSTDILNNDQQSHEEIMAPEASNDVSNDETSTPPADVPADVPVAPAIASSRKLSNEKALDILQRLDAGVKGSVLAKEYNVDSSTISDIKVGRLYKTVLADYKKSKETVEISQP